MYEFITGLAWFFGGLAIIRVFYLVFSRRSPEEIAILRLMEAMGANPIGEALVKTLIILSVCVIWLGAYYF